MDMSRENRGDKANEPLPSDRSQWQQGQTVCYNRHIALSGGG